MSEPKWRKSSYSEASGNACVEMATMRPPHRAPRLEAPGTAVGHREPGGVVGVHRRPGNRRPVQALRHPRRPSTQPSSEARNPFKA